MLALFCGRLLAGWRPVSALNSYLLILIGNIVYRDYTRIFFLYSLLSIHSALSVQGFLF